MDLDVALPFETDVVLPDGPVATRSRSDGPRDPEGRAEPAVEVGSPSLLTSVPIGVCAILTLVFGIFAQPLLELAANAAVF